MGIVLTVKLKEKGNNGPGSVRYKSTIDIKNPAYLALLFSDLELHGANIPKAYDKYKKERGDVGGFWE